MWLRLLNAAIFYLQLKRDILVITSLMAHSRNSPFKRPEISLLDCEWSFATKKR